MSYGLLRVNLSNKYTGFITSKVVLRRLFLAFFLTYILSSQVTHARQIDKLSQKSQQVLLVCQGCHGENLSGQAKLNTPALAGQSLNYLNRQMTKFQQGLRGRNEKDSTGQQMAEIAITLNNSDSLLEINQYISKLPFRAETMAITDQAKRNIPPDNVEKNLAIKAMQLRQGSNYYQGKCGACHGGSAEGNEKMFAPRLNNLSTTYLLKQMKNFSDGIRGDHTDDKYGRQMAMMAKTSTGQELSNIILFIKSKGVNKGRDKGASDGDE